MLIFALAYWGRNFHSFFGRIEKRQKALSKLPDVKWPEVGDFLKFTGIHRKPQL